MKNNKKNNDETQTEELESPNMEESISDEIDETLENESDDGDIVQLQAENTKLREDYLRAFADAENTKKRCAQEIEKNSKYAISSFAKGLLAVADNLHRAIAAVDEEHKTSCEALLTGVELTEAELMKVFNKFGITRMEIMGQVFDPNFQQVIQEVEDQTKPSGTVIAELQTGYMINDRLLREAMVVVTKGGK